MELIASRFETRRYLALLGGTTEFTKWEGLTFAPNHGARGCAKAAGPSLFMFDEARSVVLDVALDVAATAALMTPCREQHQAVLYRAVWEDLHQHEPHREQHGGHDEARQELFCI